MKRVYALLAFAFTIVAISSCKKDDNIPPPTAEVTAQTNSLAVSFTTQASNIRYFNWDFGDGSEVSRDMNPSHFYENEGTYKVTLTATGRDGSTLVKTIQVSPTAPINLIQGGKFETADDEAKWTKFAINSDNNVTWGRSSGKMIASGGNWGHAGIYQAIQVEANKNYQFSMLVAGSGASDTWFEIYFGGSAPVAGSDYSQGGTYFGLNTWNGCGNTSFNGNIATIGCAGSHVGKNGVVTFPVGGTVYLVIKTGGANLGTGGISIDNVTLTAVQ